MDSVPILFIESVSASLSRESLENLKGCRSAVWQVGAERIWTVMKEMQIEVSVPLQNHPSLYSYAIQQHSLDDLRRTKYARIDMALSPWPQDPGEASSVEGLKSLFTYANALNVESLDMYGVHRFDSLFQNFFPQSVNIIKIENCTFGADSAFPEWLRKTLRSNPLQKLLVKWTTVEGKREDLEEDLFHQSFMHRKHLEIRLYGNKNLTNFNAPLFRRVLDLWTNSEKPFPREIRYSCLDASEQELREIWKWKGDMGTPLDKDSNIHPINVTVCKWCYSLCIRVRVVRSEQITVQGRNEDVETDMLYLSLISIPVPKQIILTGADVVMSCDYIGARCYAIRSSQCRFSLDKPVVP
uniref:FBA_2 domain-containing protein n=1 Tax=Steinernema glaseri TaxID=37863 RepID=A0A1I7YEZ9_9BILA